MDQDIKDILVDGDQLQDVDALTKATVALKAEIARKDQEAKQLREQYATVAKLADDRGQKTEELQAGLHGMTEYAARAEQAAIANALAAAESDTKSMQADLAQAIHTADGKRAAELQVKLGELTARKHTLEQGKERIEEEIARAKDAPPPQQRQPAALAGDPYEAMIAPLPENQKQWLRKHKDKGYVEPGKPPTAKLLKAYYGAQDAGLREDSAAFITYMDRILGHTAAPAPAAAAPQQAEDASERFQEAPPAQAPAAQPAAKRAIPAAPPSRAQGGSIGANGRRAPPLTREQEHTAQRLGMTKEEYVSGLREGIRRGKLPASVLQNA